MANGEVQILLELQFVLFRSFCYTVRAFGQEGGKLRTRKWYNMRMGMSDKEQGAESGEFAVEKFDRNDKLQSRRQG